MYIFVYDTVFPWMHLFFCSSKSFARQIFLSKRSHPSFGNTFPNAMEFCERMPFTAMPLAKGRQRWVFDLPEADFAPHRKDVEIVLETSWKHLET